MQKIILIAGLPGSGKEHMAEQLSQSQPHCTVLNDLSQIDHLSPGSDGNGTLIIFSRDFCNEQAREKTVSRLKHIFSHATIEWIFFENRACICMENVGHRRRHQDNRQIAAEILALSKHYHVPEDAHVERVVIEKAHRRPT